MRKPEKDEILNETPSACHQSFHKPYEGFEKIEKGRIGLGKHEKFHKLMHDLKEIYSLGEN